MTVIDTMMVIFCGLLLAYGAAHDIAVRTVPNSVSIGIALLGLLHAVLAGTVLPGLSIALLVFGSGIVAWRTGLLGGGDVKLMAAVSLWFRPHAEPRFLVMIAILGGVLAVLYLLLGHLLPASGGAPSGNLARRVIRAERRRIRRRSPLPYAVAIGSAALFCLVRE